MTFKQIQSLIKKRDYLFSEHADEERIKDKLIVEEVEQAILTGKVIEERLDDPRGESRLVAGKTDKGRMIHTVIGLRFNRPVIVTVYIPDEMEWVSGIIRKRRN